MSGAPPLLVRIHTWLFHDRRFPLETTSCTIIVDGTPLSALEGQSVAAVLVRNGTWNFQRNSVSGEPRGPYCGMGVCFECEVTIDGVPARRACLIAVRDGMFITTEAAMERATV